MNGDEILEAMASLAKSDGRLTIIFDGTVNHYFVSVSFSSGASISVHAPVMREALRMTLTAAQPFLGKD